MGLLSQILGGLARNAAGHSPMGRTGAGLSPVLMALLPVVLGMLSNRGGGSGAGLGGMFGTGIPGSVSDMGGLGGLGGRGLDELLEQFTQRGYGHQAKSWVGTGPNEPLPETAIGQVLGEDQLAQIAQQAGITTDEARSGLSELLPEVVDHFTPTGQIPAGEQLSASVDDYFRQLKP